MIECAREQDVFEAIALGRWPARVDEGLRAHVAECAVCADIVLVACALDQDRESACREAHVPAAGLVWWRATIRARAEAARTATQPISVLLGVTGACAVGLACGLGTAAWRALHGALRFEDLVFRLGTHQADAGAAGALAAQHALPIALGLAACLVLAPLALYITLADD